MISIILDEYKNVIESEKKIIIYDSDDIEVLKILFDAIENKYLNIEVWQCIQKGLVDSRLKYYSKIVEDEVLELYRTFDFSDNVFVVADYTQYGSMFNYVKNGILSKEEMVDALLCEI